MKLYLTYFSLKHMECSLVQAHLYLGLRLFYKPVYAFCINCLKGGKLSDSHNFHGSLCEVANLRLQLDGQVAKPCWDAMAQ